MPNKKNKNILAILAIAAVAYYIYTKMKATTPASNAGNGGNASGAGTDNGLMAPGNKFFPLWQPSANKPITQPDFIIQYKLGVIPHTV
jgi:hypothetical protein